MTTQQLDSQASSFRGFEPPTANYIYCPNQFFDVCLAHNSRNVVRLVAYVLRKTLGWLDGNGEPINQDISVSYCELIAEAGISRGAIRKAIDDAIQAGFVFCVREGRSKAEGDVGQTAQYRLRWDKGDEYANNPKAFSGFYSGDGHRTPIPNAFFDQVITGETLGVIKLVGTVLRHTVGYQNQFGGRRSQAPLAYSFIQKYANLRDRTTLGNAIQRASRVGYIRCVSEGTFHPRAGNRRPAEYAVKWLSEAKADQVGSKTRPANRHRFKNPSSDGSKNRPADRFKNPTKQKTVKKDTDKQQRLPPAVAENSEAHQLLINVGFDEQTAKKLCESRGLGKIKQQITWLKERNPRENKLGMLRKAIEQDWPQPVTAQQKDQRLRLADEARREARQEQIDDAKLAEGKRKRKRRKDAALRDLNSMTDAERTAVETAAFDQLNSDFFRQRFRTNDEFRLQQCLDELGRREGSP